MGLKRKKNSSCCKATGWEQMALFVFRAFAGLGACRTVCRAAWGERGAPEENNWSKCKASVGVGFREESGRFRWLLVCFGGAECGSRNDALRVSVLGDQILE